MTNLLVIDEAAFEEMMTYVSQQLSAQDNFYQNKEDLENLFSEYEEPEVIYEFKIMLSKIMVMIRDYHELITKASNALSTIGENLGSFDRTIYVSTYSDRQYDMLDYN